MTLRLQIVQDNSPDQPSAVSELLESSAQPALEAQITMPSQRSLAVVDIQNERESDNRRGVDTQKESAQLTSSVLHTVTEAQVTSQTSTQKFSLQVFDLKPNSSATAMA